MQLGRREQYCLLSCGIKDNLAELEHRLAAGVSCKSFTLFGGIAENSIV